MAVGVGWGRWSQGLGKAGVQGFWTGERARRSGVNGRQIGEVGEDVVGGKMKVEIREKLVNFRKLNICRETYLEYI